MSGTTGHPPQLAWHVARNLDPATAVAIAAHLERCRECREEAAALASMRRSLLLLHRADHVPGPELVAYENGELERESARRVAVEAHLDQCHECRDDLAALERCRFVDEALQGAPRRAGRAAATRWQVWVVGSAGAAAVAVLALLALPALRRPPVRAPDAAVAAPIVFAPPRRGETVVRSIPAGGAGAIAVVLPYDAPEGTYRPRFERPDGAPAASPSTPVKTDGNGVLTLAVPPFSPGESYRLILSLDGREGPATYVYTFRVDPAGTGAAGERRP